MPFSLSQVHADEHDADVWDQSLGEDTPSGVLALCWGVTVRDEYPEVFHDFRLAVFSACHDIDDPNVLAKVAVDVGLDASQIGSRVATGLPLETLAREHTEAVVRWGVFGVPTLIEEDEAVFVMLMERGRVDDVERVLDMLTWSCFNEFKHTVIPR